MQLVKEMNNADPIKAVITGAFDGIFSGLTGVGGGAVLVPVFALFMNLPQHLAHGTSLAVIVLVALAGAATYAQAGFIDWRMTLFLMAGSVFGVVIGARLMMGFSPLSLRRGFAVFLIIVGIRLLIG